MRMQLSYSGINSTILWLPVLNLYTVTGRVGIYHIQGVPGGKVNILGGHSIGYSKQKTLYARVLFRTVSEIELFECTTAKLLIRKRDYEHKETKRASL
jgi:hypothetical protein